MVGAPPVVTARWVLSGGKDHRYAFVATAEVGGGYETPNRRDPATVILTDSFVYIHMPKTGGTFVTRAITEVYESRSALRAAGGQKGPAVSVNQHGTCRDIPESHRHLQVVSTIRNPFDHYVSQFTYGGWRKYPRPGISAEEIRRLYPHFPDLTFGEYLDLASSRFNHIKTPHLADEDQPGYHTEQFVRFYFREPEKVLAQFGRAYLASGDYRRDMYDVHFLHTDRLTEELCDFLQSIGFDEAASEIVRRLGRVAPPRVRVTPLDLLLRHKPRRTDRDWAKHYTPELIDLVRRREWFLLALYPELDVA